MPPWIVPLPPPPTTPPYAPITTRNLLYHAYCPRGQASSSANLYQLARAWPLFNGRRVIVIATGPGLYSPRTIRRALGTDAEYLEYPNDPRLRESRHFADLLWTIRSTSSHEATFYAHTKGASPLNNLGDDKHRAITSWRLEMYHALLDHWPTVEKALRRKPTCGTHLIDYSLHLDPVMRSPTGLRYGTWHYAGSFYWFRHDQVFTRHNWSCIPDDPWADEMWLGNLLPASAAHTLFQPWTPTDPAHADPYSLAAHHPLRRDPPQAAHFLRR